MKFAFMFYMNGRQNLFTMKRFSLFLVLATLLFCACDSDTVKVRGEVEGLNGTVKLLAEMPGEPGLTILAQQEVKDGKIDLRTDQFKIPGRVWIDIDGKATVEAILDTKDMIWIKGKIKFPDQIEADGSGLMDEYKEIKKMYKERFGEDIAKIDKRIEKISKKEKLSKDDEVVLGIHQLQKQRFLKKQANWTRDLIVANPRKEISLFLIKDQLVDSLDLQKKLFNKMTVENKESNIYKVLESKLK